MVDGGQMQLAEQVVIYCRQEISNVVVQLTQLLVADYDEPRYMAVNSYDNGEPTMHGTFF